jgi:hypothetical protein
MVVAVVGLIAATSGDAVAGGVKAVASVVGRDQVTSRSVKDGSLRAADVKRSERAKLNGRRGPRGANGAPGVAALDKVFRKSATFDIAVAGRSQCPGTPPDTCYVPVAQYATGAVSCDPGLVAVGGGVKPDDPQFVEIAATHPTPDGTGWTVAAANDDMNAAHGLDVFVLCARQAAG